VPRRHRRSLRAAATALKGSSGSALGSAAAALLSRFRQAAVTAASWPPLPYSITTCIQNLHSHKKQLIMYKYHQMICLKQLSCRLNKLNADNSRTLTTASPADTSSKKQHKWRHHLKC
jgi:hypothetical protein